MILFNAATFLFPTGKSARKTENLTLTSLLIKLYLKFMLKTKFSLF